MGVKLTPDQTADLRFPVGCPVWYNFQTNEAAGPPSLRRGVVRSVSFDYPNPDLLYEIGYDSPGGSNSIVDEVSERQLMFGSSCPVSVSFDESDDAVEGTVLLCRPSSSGSDDPTKVLYTVMTSADGRARYEEGVDVERIKFRRAGPTNDATAKSPTAKPDAMDVEEEVGRPPEATKSRQKDDPSAAKTSSASVPASITCSSVSKGDDGEEKKEDGGDVRGKTDGASPWGDSRDDRASAYDVSSRTKYQDQTQIQITVPAWLQPNAEVQRKLFYYLIGSRRDGRGGVKKIGRETKCRIEVNFEPKARGTVPSAEPPITIIVETWQISGAAKNLHDARERIQALLLDYLSSVVDDRGARGRLVYDVATSCPGPHRAEESASGAVHTRNPIGKGCKGSVMALVDLPYAVDGPGGTATPHYKFLLCSSTLSPVRGCDCYITICADGSRTPVRTCPPYVLVMGHSWRGVDAAVEIVKRETRQHMKYCNCSF